MGSLSARLCRYQPFCRGRVNHRLHFWGLYGGNVSWRDPCRG
ncbi:Uncharacterised protein [Vibrio cholerae]|nr:Uncharacterised protein [Vibrio cholerae]CSI82347.1 Uncharacterised protein [Vibrio cholerae]